MPIGRPQEFDHDVVLDKAMQLFWRHGYEATSLSDLTGNMGLSKSSFYQAFGNKHELFLLCIERYQQKTASEMRQDLQHCPSGYAFIKQMLTRVSGEKSELANPRGSMVTNTATEFAQTDTAVAKSVRQGLKVFRKMFRQAIVKGQLDGSVSSRRSPGELADYLLTSMSGLRTLVKAGTPATTLQKSVNLVLESIQ